MLSHPAGARTRRCEAALCAIALAACGGLTAAETVDLGDNPETRDIALDEDFFHCRIQPEILTEYRCAAGLSSDGGGCHLARSALRLVEVASTPRCQDERVVGAPPVDSEVNLERVRTTLGIDPEASPFYRRPLGLDSHPRVIFDEGSPQAELIRTWLTRSAP